MTTKVLATGTFDDWYRSSLADGQRHRVIRVVNRLRAEGPRLGRPHADSLRNTRLKELRIPGRRDVLRIVFGFDTEGAAILLVGDDKKGVTEGGQVAWMEGLVRQGEKLMLAHYADPRHAIHWNPTPPPARTDDHEDDEPRKPPPRRQGPARFSMEDAARERTIRRAEERAARDPHRPTFSHANPQLSDENYKKLVQAGYSGKHMRVLSNPGGYLDPTEPDHQKRVDDMIARAARRT